MLKNNKKISLIQDSIQRGINFLYQSQLAWGEFRTLASWNRFFLTSFFDSSPFVTSLVLYSIKDIKEEKVKIMTEKASQFFLAEQEKGGVWRFWTSKNKKKLPADLDDISNISFVLKLNNVNFDNNIDLILKNRNKEGLFLTWLMEEKYKNNFFWKRVKDDVDPVINTNVLLYLAKNDPRVCSFVNRVIKLDKFHSIYYPHQLGFYYFVSRAFKNNIFCFKENKEKIIKMTLKFQRKNGSFGNDLETALALNTLFNFDYNKKETDWGIDFLLKRQSISGCWQRSPLFLGPPFWFLIYPPFYHYYGSEELTTALCLEALKNYLNREDF